MPWSPDICIYHHPCDDGFASAWCVWKKWKDKVDFRPTNYGKVVPDQDVKGKDILVTDFSFKPEVLEGFMKNEASSIIILDHHKTAELDLEEFRIELHGINKFTYDDVDDVFRDIAEVDRPPILAVFNMEKSGASLSWEFCFSSKPMPRLITYIEDRDLWRMKYKETRPLSLYLRAHDYDFDIWNKLMIQFEDKEKRDFILDEALAIQAFYDKKISEIADTATFKTIGHHKDVPVAYAPYAFASDTAHELLQRHKDAPFAAVIVNAYGGCTYSLRSDDDRVDVSEVARSFGGGGHRNAAGFRMPG